MNHPSRIGKYPIADVLGEGAMGVVYRAEDPVIGRPVAIKTVHKRLLADEAGADFAARFRNEARSAGRLLHPNIVTVYEYGEDEESAYLVMEYVEGRTLAQLLQADPLPAEGVLLRWMDQLLDALECAHRHGVWHRDVKPANLIVAPDGTLKVTDFGIARIASSALTQAGAAIGTPGYMAPEQYLGEDIDQRVDVFAAGVLLYRLLAGRPPFAGSAEAVMYQLFHHVPPPPSQVEGSGRDARFDAVVARAMARDRLDRFERAGALRGALAEAAAAPSDQATVVLAPPGPAASPAPLPAAAAPALPLAADLVEQATRVLTTRIGPIARILVKKASARAASREQFVQLLVESTDAGVDRAKLRAELERLG